MAFGRPIAEQGVTLERIAESRIAIEQTRLLTLKTAWLMDSVGNKAARAEIAMIKIAAPNMACRIVDWAIQACGGAGTSNDFGLAAMHATARLRHDVDAGRGVKMVGVGGAPMNLDDPEDALDRHHLARSAATRRMGPAHLGPSPQRSRLDHPPADPPWRRPPAHGRCSSWPPGVRTTPDPRSVGTAPFGRGRAPQYS